MFEYLTLLSLITVPSYSYRPFEFYEYVCNSNFNCYTLFLDSSILSSSTVFKSIERWPYITPYSDSSTNIGFAQSHAQAMSFKLWQNDPSLSESVFSESSIIRAAKEAGYSVCGSPIMPSNHLPFQSNFIENHISMVYLKPAFQEFDSNGKWCDLEGLAQVDLASEKGFEFPGYDYGIVISSMDFYQIKELIKQKGIGMVLINHDYNMIDGFEYFDEGIYRPEKEVYNYPANVVGVRQDENGNIWLMAYVFGAHQEENNYLWISPEDIVGDYIVFIKDFKVAN